MKLTPIVERLKEAGLKRVYGALELAGLDQAPSILPAYFVVPQGWEAGPQRYASGMHDQKVAEQFGVVIVMNGVALSETRVSEDIEERQNDLVASLVGWRHPQASVPFEAGAGRLLSVSGKALQWLITFRASTHIRKAVS
jgi:hypothetical protein